MGRAGRAPEHSRTGGESCVTVERAEGKSDLRADELIC